MIYLYDGSFEGFETAIFHAWRDGTAQIIDCMPGPSLFDVKVVATDEVASNRVEAGMSRLSPSMPSDVYRAWLSREDGIDDVLLGTIRVGFAKRCDPFAYRQDDCCRRAAEAERRVGLEQHRFLEFVRFAQIDENVYVSDIEPSYDILPLIAGHFFGRMGGVKFVIRDISRMRAAVSDGKHWYIAELDGEQVPFPLEDGYSAMWRDYFEHMAIRQRINPKLQRQLVPSRYRNHLTEFQNENTEIAN